MIRRPTPDLVLVVDDDPLSRMALHAMIDQTGARCITARDGRDGFLKCLQERPALVLTDLHMPRVDGFELIRSLRSSLGDEVPPLVVVTSDTNPGMHRAAVDAGAVRTVEKPVRMEGLVAILAEFMPEPPVRWRRTAQC